ncbi:MAG: hypothetical protein JWO12_1889 [Frankiales bacterium]|nr:hypothetical protein [Frankiales bacterium]
MEDPLKRVLALAALIFGTTAALAMPANAAGLCINADINVNGTAQTISQCLPPA